VTDDLLAAVAKALAVGTAVAEVRDAITPDDVQNILARTPTALRFRLNALLNAAGHMSLAMGDYRKAAAPEAQPSTS
jgi:hypothetical protein